ncbi:MAG: TIGR04211 family SH3 domain-containing protein [Gammaproteobacteria bacterium]|nr:TIGR04211 family SH3 domain-containing protein [Gammaproteobacteria bacterium]
MSSAQAEDRWVTDEFEIMMRSGKGSNQRILRQLKSGTQLEVLQTDEESGYTKVRVSSGAEGWVLTRYLRVTPTSKLTLPTVEKKLTRTSAKNAELNKDIAALKKERQSLQGEVAELQENNSLLQGQVDRITKLSANTIQVDDQNKQLKQRLSDSEKQIDELESNNAQLGSRANREWFLVGGAVLVLGLLLGLILPRMNWRKKSTW